MEKTVDMTKGSPVRLLIQFSIPILIGNLFQQAYYTLADRIIVGRFVGDSAFSAGSFIGKWGICLTTGLTWTVTALFALGRYKHGAWKTKKLI